MSSNSFFCLIVILATFFLLSLLIFDNVYKTTTVVVDEEFHLPLGLAYCRNKFSFWDAKVTTLPGMYLISTFILAPFEACSIYWLRFVSLCATVLNIPLLYILLSKHNKGEWNNILSSVTLVLLPPVYFFSHFYYTDVISLTTILLMLIFYEYKCHYMSSIFGLVAVLCRQTNIMWVCYLFGQYVLNEMSLLLRGIYYIRGGPRTMPLEELKIFKDLIKLRPGIVLKSLPLDYVMDCCCYISVICTFVLFMLVNGSVVVGDKTAHEVTMNIPQLFYFSLFCLIFGWPHFVGEVSAFITYVKNHKKFILVMFNICLLIVKFNTVVHQYMLADNRHYIFYIWSRFYGKYPGFRFTMVPVYMFAWYVICKNLYHKYDVGKLFLYLPTVILLLVPQKLIEVRYYLVPYIIFRLNVKNNPYTVFNMILEIVTYIVINGITFNLFFNKLIDWPEYDQPQRLIW